MTDMHVCESIAICWAWIFEPRALDKEGHTGERAGVKRSVKE